MSKDEDTIEERKASHKRVALLKKNKPSATNINTKSSENTAVSSSPQTTIPKAKFKLKHKIPSHTNTIDTRGSSIREKSSDEKNTADSYQHKSTGTSTRKETSGGGRPYKPQQRQFNDKKPYDKNDKKFPDRNKNNTNNNRPDNRNNNNRPDNRGGKPPGQGGRTSFDKRGIPIQNAPSTQSSGKTGRSESGGGGSETAKRTFKATRKKQFVNKRKQFFEKEILINRKKNEPQVIANPIPKSISIMESVSIADLAKKMNLKSSALLSKLMAMGMMVNQNSVIDYETAQLLASEYECEIQVISLYEQTLIETPDENLEMAKKRPPVVTIMGHVDHGKTTLLDTIRKSNVVDNEQGNITQHIGAYMVDTGHGKISFLDTPGHEAFSMMRSRGAKLTDIIVLVVAADDGLMPQTIESIVHAKESKVPIIVALNKMDAPASNPDRILQQLTENELIPEEWGGDIAVCRISALKNEGIDDLLEHIILQTDLMELKADDTILAQGIVLESKIEPGRGIVASVLIQKGILKKSDNFVVGVYHGKVRDIFDDRGVNIKEATPSMPVEIIGIDGMPSAGDPFQATESDKIAKQISIKRQELMRHKAGENIKRVTADTLYESIEKENTDILKIIIKGDVHGSVEAIKESLEKIVHAEISVKVIHASAGNINAADILLASTSGSLIIGFNVRPNQQVQKLANQERVEIQKYTIIFDVIDSIKKRIEGLLSPDYKEEKIGELVVREIFKIPKGIIAGSYVHDGKIERDSLVKVMRNGKEIHTGKVVSLKRFKDDVNKVETGYECGVGIDGTDELQAEDIFMVYKKIAVAKTL